MTWFIVLVAFLGCVLAVVADPPLPKDETPSSQDYKDKQKNIIELLRKANYYDIYRDCIQKTKSAFGMDWLNKNVYDDSGNFVSIDFPYAYQYLCEDTGMGMFEGEEADRLHDGTAFRKSILKTISDEHKTIKDYFLGQADCLDICYKDQSKMPKYEVVMPEKMPAEVTENQKKWGPPNHRIDDCAMKQCNKALAGLNDKTIFEVDRMVYEYFANL